MTIGGLKALAAAAGGGARPTVPAPEKAAPEQQASVEQSAEKQQDKAKDARSAGSEKVQVSSQHFEHVKHIHLSPFLSSSLSVGFKQKLLV